MRRPKGIIGKVGGEIGETVKEGREQVSLGKAFEELLKQIFGGARPLSAEEEKKLKEKEEEAKRKARAQVLAQFMPTPQEERIYYQRQKEEAAKRLKEEREKKEKAWEATAQSPKGRKKRGSLFEFLRRKVTKTERKIGGKF